ncbi:hypothetical protein GGI25_003107 [Coemansia spiralis]|uniref:Uncharacterized protein n=2 Tax=Coemansia TaxID=4863 RepID=A0A9W8KYG9_9FUNG|nr:hypothetical protein EDC05_001460 [Coemansia umbellata]KAJ2624350.1 hypothetical protein GGI26_001484 [Coemansia sp. RSA 1358]KAJ2677587.1 hypothetical protein GGI25_003107 [Coemansia spiralis]
MYRESWVQRLHRHALLLPWRDMYKQEEKEDADNGMGLVCGAGQSEVQVMYVGKDSTADTCKCHCGSASHPIAGYCDVLEEDTVPYLDDCDEEQMAAQIARQRKLFRRSLRRVGVLLSR